MAFSQDLLNRLTIALAEPAAANELDAAVSAATGEVSDVAYGVSWNGVTSIAPSKNAVYDKIETMIAQTITNGVTTSAPSQDVVFDALALKLTASQALNVVALAGTLTGTTTGTMADVAADACAGGATPASTDVDTCVASLALEVNLQLKELQTKVNEEIAALKTALIQASA